MSVTIKDIAKIANVSYSTVSRALNDIPGVKLETRDRIVKIAKEQGYSPNAIARGLVSKSTNMIGLVIPDITNPYFPEVARGIEDFASRNKRNVFLCNSNWESEKELVYIRALQEKRVEGLLVAPVEEGTHERIKNEKLDIPVVYISSMSGDPGEMFVIVDNIKASYLATEHLIKLGHSNIAFIGGSENSISNRDRIKGYMDALKRYSIKMDISMVKSSSYKRESGYAAALELVKTKRVPTGLIAANDIIALGIIEALEGNSYRVPQDVSVIGFDDIAFASLPKINLTTVAQPKYEMGLSAADILFKKISGTEQGSDNNYQHILEPQLIIRGTTGPV